MWVVVATGVVAAACLAWPLRIPAGDQWFYPATFILAAVYIIGSSTAVRMTGERLPWAVTPRGRLILVTTVAYTLVTSLAGIPLLALAAAALSALVGWLRERTRSFLPCVVAHLIWSLTMLFVLPSVV